MCSRLRKESFLLRIDEVKGENELKRENRILLSFLRKHNVSRARHPMQDRMGRFLSQFEPADAFSLFKYHEGKTLLPPAHPAESARDESDGRSAICT